MAYRDRSRRSPELPPAVSDPPAVGSAGPPVLPPEPADSAGSKKTTVGAAKSPALIWFALTTVYLVWGSTYLAIRVVVDTAPPLLAMGVRFLLAGLILATILGLKNGVSSLRVTRREVRSAALVGVLLLLGGNGAVALAEQTVPSGLAALLIAATPFFLVCLRTGAGDRPRAMSVFGTIVGFVGIALLARPDNQPADVEAWGVLLILVASFSWAVGSFLSPRLTMPANPFVATAWEMSLGGVALIIAGLAHGETRGLDLGDVAGEAWAALAYLVVFGSLAAFTAYIWLLHNAPISLTATYAYVNPVVAVLLGALILSEQVTLSMVVGGAVVVVGVALVVTTERPRSGASDTT